MNYGNTIISEEGLFSLLPSSFLFKKLAPFEETPKKKISSSDKINEEKHKKLSENEKKLNFFKKLFNISSQKDFGLNLSLHDLLV